MFPSVLTPPLYVACLLSALVVPLSAQSPFVVTNYGFMKGTTMPALDTSINAYLGIPYARPPIKDLRFARPQPPVIPPGYSATVIRPPCPQFGSTTEVTGSEDCLYLNIYVPISVHKLAVFVWIYGYGSFTKGDAQTYDAERLAVQGDVVVVTFNYRLGVFGFLSSGDDNLSGNFGLADQHMAIKWVRDNVASFGGDDTRITICGLSSGAASVGFHMMNSKTKSLFHRGIMQSGGATSSWSINRQPRKTFLELAARTDCYNKNVTGASVISSAAISDIVRCLRTRTALEMIEADLSVLKESGQINSVIDKLWVPVIDGDYIADDPSALLSNFTYLNRAGFYEFDLLAGVTKNEGDLFYYNLVPALMSRGENESLFDFRGSTVNRTFFEDEVIPSLVEQRFGEAPYITTEAIIHRYENLDLTKLGKDEEPVVAITPMLRSYEDPAFVAPMIEQCRRHASELGKTFMYLQDHVTGVDGEAERGLSHGGDAPYVFGLGPKVMERTLTENVTESDRKMSDIVIKYWTNFAKSGDPNQPDTSVPITWPAYEQTLEQYAILSSNMTQETSVGRKLYSERADFWIDFLPKLYKVSRGLPTSCGNDQVRIMTVPAGKPRTTVNIFATNQPKSTKPAVKTVRHTISKTTPATTTEDVGIDFPSMPKPDKSWVKQPNKPTDNNNSSKHTSTTCSPGNGGRLERFNMDVAMAETTIISLIAVSAILALLSFVVSCMLCARRRSDPDMGKF